MNQPDRDEPGAALRAQILSTEHWSLLATRSATWHEIFSRTTIFLTVLSATVVALSLVVQAAGFGTSFRMFALVVLPIVLLVGVATYIRLVEADIEDAWLVIGMNRLRHGYLQLAPDLEPYFITSHHDDEVGVLQTYSFRRRVGVTHLLAGSPVIVGIIDALLSGVLAAIVCQAFGAPTWLQVGVGVLVVLAAGAVLGSMLFRRVSRLRHTYQPRFPSDGTPE
jgi:type IV secretory pathway TrbD component